MFLRRRGAQKGSVRHLSILGASAICPPDPRGPQLDKYLDAPLRSAAPRRIPLPLTVNRGRAGHIPLEGGIYKVADGGRGDLRARAVNKELTPVRPRLAAHRLALLAQSCVC